MPPDSRTSQPHHAKYRDPDRRRTEFQRLDVGIELLTAAERRDRGNEFENLLYSVLWDEELEPRTRFRPEGEEIDGSFVLFEKVFLLEAKWHKDPMPASELYAFKGKVDGKISGTLGIFISMSGYSEDAIAAFQKGKELTVVCFDGDDTRKIFRNEVDFRQVLRWKLRQAAEIGEVYVPFRDVAPPAPAGPTHRQALWHLEDTVLVLSVGDVPEAYVAEVVRADPGAMGARVAREADHRFGSFLIELKRLASPLASLRLIPQILNQADQKGHQVAGLVVLTKQPSADWEAELRQKIAASAFPTPLEVLGVTHDSIADDQAAFRRFMTRLADSDAPWDSAAKNAVQAALEEADWDPEAATVTFRDLIEGHSIVCKSIDELRDHLANLAGTEFHAHVPYENGPVFDSDDDGIVDDALDAYRERFEEMGWDY